MFLTWHKTPNEDKKRVKMQKSRLLNFIYFYNINKLTVNITLIKALLSVGSGKKVLILAFNKCSVFFQ
jgi:hypothetical protein